MSTRTDPDQYLALPGARLRWRRAGHGCAIVLLHGWPLDLEYWSPVSGLLQQQSTVLAFDRRGFGLSRGTPDIHGNVDDLCAVMNAAAIDRAVIVGMSQGARLALHFAIQHPARTRALVLDGAPALAVASEVPLAGYRAVLEQSGLDALRALVMQHPLMQLRTGNSDARRLLDGIMARYRGLDLLQSARPAPPPDLARIAQPVLVLNGGMDTAARLDAGRALQASIAGAQRRLIEGAGHLAALDDPAACAAAITEFCRDLPP